LHCRVSDLRLSAQISGEGFVFFTKAFGSAARQQAKDIGMKKKLPLIDGR
jgi:hypothetical protein